MKIEKNLEHAEIDATRINKNPSAESRELLSDDISLREDENKLYALLMEGITEQYQEVIDAVTVFVNQEDGKELDDTKLSFVMEEEKRAIAWANSSKNEITFNLPRYFRPKILRVATHEIAHIICDKYVKPSLGHSLEFAIITYCLDYKLDICKSNFLISYDIHEDIAYNFLRINPCEFDAIIRCISWNSIRELAEKAKLVAEKIRTENVPLNLYKGEKL